MGDAACVLWHVRPPHSPSSDVRLARSHTAMASTSRGNLHAAELVDLHGDVKATLVAARGASGKSLAALAQGSPLAGRWPWRVAGADGAIFAGAEAARAAPSGYLELALDLAEPPVPFDDPSVVGVLRDQLQWYLPLLGGRHVVCAALAADDARAAGALVAFSASSDGEAQWLAAQDPWRRIAPGMLLRHPGGIFRALQGPPGPGTQRMGSIVCH